MLTQFSVDVETKPKNKHNNSFKATEGMAASEREREKMPSIYFGIVICTDVHYFSICG